MFSTIAMVALGGAFGAVSRYGVNVGATHFFGHGFPWGTVIVNVVGSFLMGIVIAKFAQADHLSPEMKSMIVTGFLGAFTTFSTFSLDFVTLWQRGEIIPAMLYMLGSVIISILALGAAMYIMRGAAA